MVIWNDDDGNGIGIETSRMENDLDLVLHEDGEGFEWICGSFEAFCAGICLDFNC